MRFGNGPLEIKFRIGSYVVTVEKLVVNCNNLGDSGTVMWNNSYSEKSNSSGKLLLNF